MKRANDLPPIDRVCHAWFNATSRCLNRLVVDAVRAALTHLKWDPSAEVPPLPNFRHGKVVLYGPRFWRIEYSSTSESSNDSRICGKFTGIGCSVGSGGNPYDDPECWHLPDVGDQ